MPPEKIGDDRVVFTHVFVFSLFLRFTPQAMAALFVTGCFPFPER